MSNEGNGEKSTHPDLEVRSGGSRMQYRCSFCGKSQDEVQRLIAGPGAVYICNECVSLCQEIITEERADKPEEPVWESDPHRTIIELMQDEQFVKMAAKRNLVFQVGIDKQIKVYQELDSRNYIFGVGPRGRNIVYRVVDDTELYELDQTLSEEINEEGH